MTTSPQDDTTPQPDDEAVEAATPVRRGPRRAIAIVGAVGVVGLLAGGGIGYAVGHDGSSATAADSAGGDLALPSTLSGGFKRSTAVDAQLKSAVSSASTALGAGTDMALYAKGKTQMLVEASRLPGSALLQAGMTYAKVGDAVCATGSSGSGSGTICLRSGDALTVKVTAATSAVATKYVDELYDSLA